MTQEEKAHRYDEAIIKVKALYGQPLVDNTLLETIFPELKESENEKIRKAIHIYLDWLDGHKDYQPKGDYTIKDMIAWLEKQGEQKPSSEQMKALNAINVIGGISYAGQGQVLIELYNDLKKIKEGNV